MKNPTLITAITLSLGLLSITGANAALVGSLDGKTVYDTDLNITWLADANLAATNTFGVSGISPYGYMNWYTAQTWIGAMNAANYLGYTDWRLPTTLQPDASCVNQIDGFSFGFNCTGSEMGHLFYNELGAMANVGGIALMHNANYNLFSNFETFYYWSGTDQSNTNIAWALHFNYGGQQGLPKDDVMYALAVRDGDVAAVPEASTYAMLLAGLGLVGFMVRRRKQAEA